MNATTDYNPANHNPVTDDLLMGGRIGIIAYELGQRLNITGLRAMHLFYESETCRQLHDHNTGLYLYGDKYIADEFMLEMQQKQ